MSCGVCGSPFPLSHFGDCRAATGMVPPMPHGSVADGFGNEWTKCKADCRMAVVRPGKADCDCDWRSGRNGCERPSQGERADTP